MPAQMCQLDFPASHYIEEGELHWHLFANRNGGGEYVFTLALSNSTVLLKSKEFAFQTAEECLELFFSVMLEIERYKEKENRMGVLDCCEGNGFRVSIERAERVVNVRHCYIQQGCYYTIRYGEKAGEDWNKTEMRFEEVGDGKGKRMAFQAYHCFARKTRQEEQCRHSTE